MQIKNTVLVLLFIITASAILSADSAVSFEGHKTYINSIAYSPDGAKIVSADTYGTIRLWNAETGSLIRTHTMGSGYATAVFSPDSTCIAAADWTEIKIYNVNNGFLVKTIISGEHYIEHITYSPDGRYIAACTSTGKIQIWNIQTGKIYKTYNTYHNYSYCLKYSPDGTKLACESTYVEIWDFETDAYVRLDNYNFGKFVFTPDGNSIAVVLNDTMGNINTIQIRDSNTGSCTRTFEYLTELSDDSKVKAIEFSPDGNMILCGLTDNSILLWDFDSGKLIDKIQFDNSDAWSAAFAPDMSSYISSTALTANTYPVMHLYEFELSDYENMNIADRGKTPEGRLVRTLSGHNGNIWSIAYSPDGRYIASGTNEASIQIWNADTGALINTFTDFYGAVTELVFSIDGEYIIAAESVGPVTKREFSGDEVMLATGNDYPIYALAFSPDGEHYAAAGYERKIFVWSVNKSYSPEVYPEISFGIDSLSYSSDGKYLASAGGLDAPYFSNISGECLYIWDTRTGEIVQSFYGHDSTITSVAFSPDSRYIVSGGWDNSMGSSNYSLKLWNIDTGKLVFGMEEEGETVHDAAFSPDGRYIASVSDFPRLWDARTGELLMVFPGHTEEITCIEFSPDGRYIATGSYDDTIKIWAIED